MVDEVHEHGQVDQHEPQGDRDGQVRDEVRSVPWAIDPGRGPRTRRSPRRCRGSPGCPGRGGSCAGCAGRTGSTPTSCDDRDREHDPDHRDDRRGERREDLSCGVSGSVVDPARQVQMTLVGKPIDPVGARKSNTATRSGRGDEPQRRTQRLPPPLELAGGVDHSWLHGAWRTSRRDTTHADQTSRHSEGPA